MKQHHLSTKFLRFYILIGILGFFLITLGGSYMVEKHLEHSLVPHFIQKRTISHLTKQLKAISLPVQ